MGETLLFVAQRISALIMAPLVIIHLGLMVYAVQGGLDSAEILSRTRGSVGWGFFYELFVIAVSVHTAIGVRTVVQEWTGMTGRGLEIFAACVALGLAVLGSYAVLSVTLT